MYMREFSTLEPRITVFTPTFNRGRFLTRVYRSLQEQTIRQFEWLIVDDGSQDNTEEIVGQWMADSQFPILYVRQPNSGKHVAINRGTHLAKGELFVILDSDDWLLPPALERILFWWESIPCTERSSFAGVAGLYADPSGAIIGSALPRKFLDSNAIEVRTRWKLRGDKLEVYRTDVLRMFPFPEDLGKFVPEGLVWNRIAAAGYKMRYVNEVWAVADYQPDGLSAKSVYLRAQSPRAARLYYKEFTELTNVYIPVLRRIREYANFTRFSLHAQISPAQQWKEVRSKALWLIALPIGLAAFLRDLTMLRRNGQ
jgi:glycosyltransferase involved in cell wall biosynthesis